MNTRRKNNALTEYEESLCQAFLLTGNQTEALRQSLYKTDKMKPDRLIQKASELFAKPHIKARVAELQAERVERTKIDADYVLLKAVEIQELDILDILNDNLSIKPITEWPKPWRLAVSSIDVFEEYSGRGEERELIGFIKRLRIPDKVKNLELIGKHVDVQAFKERIVVEDETDHAAILEKRAKFAEEQASKYGRNLKSEPLH